MTTSLRVKAAAGVAAAALLGCGGTAVAQDVASPFSWDGFYAGVHVGYGWGDDEGELFEPFFNDTHDRNIDLDGLIGGVQAGFNFQLGPSLIAGIEGDFSWSDIDGDESIEVIRDYFGLTTDTEIDWLAAIRARIGFLPTADRRLLVYAAGGLAAGDVAVGMEANFGGTVRYAVSDSDIRYGWAIGTGVQYALSAGLRLGLDYRYVDLGEEEYDFDTDDGTASIDSDVTVSTIRLSIDYYF